MFTKECNIRVENSLGKHGDNLSCPRQVSLSAV